jgi:PhzF family phenazine biosynthesis protein
MDRRFAQVDVFGTSAATGNPVAVVLDGTGLDVAWMQRLAAWLNVAETTFVLPTKDPDADYRVRIFTVAEELPFAGHPTLGTCHAWLAAGNRPRHDDTIVQECGAGLIRIRRGHAGFAFASPPLRRSGPVDDHTRAAVMAALGVDPGEVLAMEWVDNGPGWLGVLLDSIDRVLALDCGPVKHFIGVAAVRDDGDLEVRAFYPVRGAMVEDPVCGSLNAALARWLPNVGAARFPYRVYQGAAVGRSGRLDISDEDGDIWVTGSTHRNSRWTYSPQRHSFATSHNSAPRSASSTTHEQPESWLCPTCEPRSAKSSRGQQQVARRTKRSSYSIPQVPPSKTLPQQQPPTSPPQAPTRPICGQPDQGDR